MIDGSKDSKIRVLVRDCKKNNHVEYWSLPPPPKKITHLPTKKEPFQRFFLKIFHHFSRDMLSFEGAQLLKIPRMKFLSQQLQPRASCKGIPDVGTGPGC